MNIKRKILVLIFPVVIISLISLIYVYGPGFLNFNDGPYFSKLFESDTDQLDLHSKIYLTRITGSVYTLESRFLDDKKEESVLVLKKIRRHFKMEKNTI